MSTTNAAPEKPQPPAIGDAANRLTRRWILLTLLGSGFSVCLVVTGVFGDKLTPIEAGIAIGAGWIAMLCLTPWRLLAILRDERILIAKLTDRLSRALSQRREEPLSDLILDRDDEIGQLSRVIHDTLVQAIAHRAEARMLSRNMDVSIRRETERATADLQRQASTDPLTGLGNRRLLTQRLVDLSASSSIPGGHIAVMVIDLNHFKKINDTLGHEVGDECLSFLGTLLKSSVRSEDCAVRTGGDEFIVIMPGRASDQAMAVAERLRSLFAQMPWRHRSVTRPTLSIGIAVGHAREGWDPEDLIRRADAMMYAAKRAARAA